MSLQEQKLGFVKDFRAIALNTAGVKDVKFFGSFLDDEWEPGKSDIDVFVEGKVSSEDKKRLRKEIIRLNNIYRLQLEAACYLHHTPIFEDDRVMGPAIKALLRGERKDAVAKLYQKSLKKLCIPHRVAWKMI